jgi:hypothetical protein
VYVQIYLEVQCTNILPALLLPILILQCNMIHGGGGSLYYSTKIHAFQKQIIRTIKIFNSLPWDINTCIDNPRIFKKAVQKCLYTKFFYSLNEYYDKNNINFSL